MLNVPKIRDTFNIGNYENNYGVLYFVIICKITGYLSLIRRNKKRSDGHERADRETEVRLYQGID